MLISQTSLPSNSSALEKLSFCTMTEYDRKKFIKYPSCIPSWIIETLPSLHSGFKSWVFRSWTTNFCAICQWKKMLKKKDCGLRQYSRKCGPCLPKLPRKQKTIAKMASWIHTTIGKSGWNITLLLNQNQGCVGCLKIGNFML